LRKQPFQLSLLSPKGIDDIDCRLFHALRPNTTGDVYADGEFEHHTGDFPWRRLREFSADGDGIATLVCTPLALHDATLTDFAPGHSLVAAASRAIRAQSGSAETVALPQPKLIFG
jgi:hypothetical protein